MHFHRSASLAVTALVLFSAPPTVQGAIGILSDSSDMLGKICYSFVLTLSIMQLIPPLVLLAFFIAAAIRCLGPVPVKEQRQSLRGGKL
jgi:CHASE2 domain-containing sensor protein